MYSHAGIIPQEAETQTVKITLYFRSGGGLFSGINRTFFTETFWYKYAQPVS